MNLVRVAPDPGDDALEIRSISSYHGFVVAEHWLMSLICEKGCNWCQDELRLCSYFAAVALDRRLAPAAE
jgi:hypothetical protein